MARYRGRRNYGGRSKRRGLTAAQEAAHDKAYAACDHTIQGQFRKGTLISDGRQAWKIVTFGIRYHEDVPDCIYGVVPCNGTTGWKHSVAIRDAIEGVLAHGTNEPGSRGGDSANQQPRPEGQKLSTWTDQLYDSMATCETISVYEGGIIGVCRPIYDDSPVVVWARDGKLAKRLLKLIEQCPEPVCLPEAFVKERYTTLKIDESHPRFAAYMAARQAEYTPPRKESYGDFAACIKMPNSEYRRIKDELDSRHSN